VVQRPPSSSIGVCALREIFELSSLYAGSDDESSVAPSSTSVSFTENTVTWVATIPR
jgi:hypothetical protein